jgi:hypothetical protein
MRMRLLFTAWRFRIPSPPSFFGMQMSFMLLNRRLDSPFFPYTCPPEIPNDRSKFCNDFFGEKNIGHTVYKD